MIIISSPTPQVGEIETIHSLFENGLELLHVRKPEFTKLEMEVFVSAIRQEYRNQLSLHSHHQLAEAFGINRIHFTEKNEMKHPNCLKDWKNEDLNSTSIHSMSDFEKLSNVFDYAFFGPVFESISKPVRFRY
jgi:thiamine-phosphate pyrophosphorylase